MASSMNSILSVAVMCGLGVLMMIGGFYTYLTYDKERSNQLSATFNNLTLIFSGRGIMGSSATKALLDPRWQQRFQERYEEVLANYNLTDLCSTEYREAEYLKVKDSGWPRLLQGWCEYPRCEAYTVDNFLKSLRRRNRTTLLEMQPCDIYKLIFGRTVWIVGDSQSQYFYRTLRCALRDFYKEEGVQDQLLTTDEAEAKLLQETVFLNYGGGVAMPVCTELVGDTRLCHIRVNMGWHLVDQYLPNLQLFNISKTDIFIFNIGLWHHQKEKTYDNVVGNITSYYKANKERLPITIWRDNSPQHFAIKHGEFPHPEDVGQRLVFPIKCEGIPGLEIAADGSLYGNDTHAVTGGWRNHISEPLIKESGMLYLHTWNETALLWKMHTVQENGNKECTHFCFPGPYHVWVWMLHDLLADLQATNQMPLPPWTAVDSVTQS